MLNDIRFQGQKEAIEALQANKSLRYLRLEYLEAWANGTQYDNRPSWWDDKVPLWERAPCVVYPVVEIAAASNVDLCLGEGRFPEFSSKQSGDDSADSDTIDRFIRSYHKKSRFQSHSRDALHAAQISGSVCSIHGVRNGKPFQDLVPSKWCAPTFDPETGDVVSLEIRYPYVEEKRKGRDWHKEAKLYRRVIDEQSDTEYLPAPASQEGVEPEWKVNKARSVKHELGFCPVVWYAFMRGTTTVGSIDGKAIHAKVTDEIQAHDIARSQWHRGALLSEPQICEIGVPSGFSPTSEGRRALVPMTERGGEHVSDPEVRVTANIVDPKPVDPARKKGPGYVWQYPNEKTKLQVLEYGAAALKAQQDNASDLRIKLQEALAVVLLDPENIKFAATTSGKALLTIKQKQIDRCSQFRDDMDEWFFAASVSMQLRISHALLSRGARLRVDGADDVLSPLSRFVNKDGLWDPPEIETKYGPYFKPDPAEERQIVELVQTALGSGGGVPLITIEVAVSRISKIFGIPDPQIVIDALKQDVESTDDNGDDPSE